MPQCLKFSYGSNRTKKAAIYTNIENTAHGISDFLIQTVWMNVVMLFFQLFLFVKIMKIFIIEERKEKFKKVKILHQHQETSQKSLATVTFCDVT